MGYDLLSRSGKHNKRGGPDKSGRVGKFFEKKNKRLGTHIRDPRVTWKVNREL